jgi:hypothetical protein
LAALARLFDRLIGFEEKLAHRRRPGLLPGLSQTSKPPSPIAAPNPIFPPTVTFPTHPPGQLQNDTKAHLSHWND